MSDTVQQHQTVLKTDNTDQSHAAPLPEKPIPATRSPSPQSKAPAPNRLILVLGGLFTVALLIFVFEAPRKKHFTPNNSVTKPDQRDSKIGSNKPSALELADNSPLPITDSVNEPNPAQSDALQERDVQRTATQMPHVDSATAKTPDSLGAIPDFTASANDTISTDTKEPVAAEPVESEHKPPDSPSIVFVRQTKNGPSQTPIAGTEAAYSLGFPPGFRLRARLESMATTAVRMPVVATVEYNYERDGIVVVPAGTKAIGHIEQADLSGYMAIKFETLLVPNAGSLPIDAIATDINLQPLKGHVAGKNTGKQIAVRALGGIGEIGSMLVGRSNLNQPLSESDMLRERVGQNIGQASDRELTSLAVTQHAIVTVPANTPVYLILQHSTGSSGPETSGLPKNEQQNIEQLKQLLQLQRELANSEQQQK